MTLTQRRILTLFLGLLLLIVSPLIILYAAGYRYNFEKHRVEKVGLLYVTTDPNDTKISVDGQDYTVGKELILRSLSQGEHDITLSLDGYHTWYKTLDIYKGQSTFITDHIMFLDQESEPAELFAKKLTLILQDDEKSFFQAGDFLFAYDFLTKEVLEIQLNSDETISNAEYAPGLNLLLFKQNTDWQQIDLATNEVTLITTPLETNKLIEANGRIYALTDSAMYSVTQTAPELFIEMPNLQDVIAGEVGYWLLASDSGETQNFIYQVFDTTTRPLLVAQFPFAESFNLVEDYRGFITVHDETNSILYLVDTSTTIPTTESLFGVRQWEWSQNHRQLLAATEFELTIHHFDNGIRQELLLRLSEPIYDIAWYESETHIFYTTDTDLFIIERDDRDRRNQFELADVSEGHVILGSDETSIEYFSSLEKGSFFFKRQLRN